MTGQRKKFERKTEPVRKRALIEATLSLIASKGIDATTVRAIAQHANVTQGLIRYYFTTKEELVTAAYEHHMTSLTEATSSPVDEMKNAKAAERLAQFIIISLTPPIVNPESVALWAGFLNRVRQDENMRSIHQATYYDFRDRIEVLITETMSDQGRELETMEAKQLAIACNAIIDGLWLEGGVLPEVFEPGELAEIGLRSISAILQINLMNKRLNT